MLPKPRRLAKEKDYKNIFKLGRSYYTKLLGVKAVANQLGFNRFGIIVSAKVSRKAVERNRLKRQLRQIAKDLDENMISGFNLAIMALPGLLKQDYKTIKSELEKIFVKLKLLKL